MKKVNLFLISIISLLINACMAEYNSLEFQKNLNVNLVDSFATKETVLLFNNLKKLSSSKVVFGHHDDTAYGIGWKDEPNRSDVKDVCGSFPGLYGWDFGFLTNGEYSQNVIQKNKKLVTEAFARGGVNTFCWHFSNPVTNGSFYDTTIAVNKIIPGGGFYLKYLSALDKIADYANHLVDSSGIPIPIIFRPFHEFDGEWFWWGKPYCTADEFKELWRTTVTYLRDKRNVKNIIYAFSPDRKFNTLNEFLERYPGDEYVDLVGMDNYWDFTPDGDGVEAVTKKLQIISDYALAKNKLAAMTETGLESIPNDKWWTDKLLKSFDQDSINLAYVMVWRNNDKKHHYAPYIGHPSSQNFIEFTLNSKILLERDLPNLYSSEISDDTIKIIDLNKKIQLIKILGNKILSQ